MVKIFHSAKHSVSGLDSGLYVTFENATLLSRSFCCTVKMLSTNYCVSGQFLKKIKEKLTKLYKPLLGEQLINFSGCIYGLGFCRNFLKLSILYPHLLSLENLCLNFKINTLPFCLSLKLNTAPYFVTLCIHFLEPAICNLSVSHFHYMETRMLFPPSCLISLGSWLEY